MQERFGDATAHICGICRGASDGAVDMRGYRVCGSCLRSLDANVRTKREILFSFGE